MVAMTRPLHPLRGAQRDASDPARHVWLAASAGTGKTQVLAARVFRLLLAGSRPEAILCLTFTKAGAAEMAERISSTLARWVRLERMELFNELRGLGEPATPDQVERARTLFARVLDAQGGLRIQTIHGFCQSLLAAFPAEAGLVPGFRPLEPREQALLRREALARLLEDETREGRVAIADAIGALAMRLGEAKAEAFLHACAARPDAMAALPMGTGIGPFVRRALELPTGDVHAAIQAACGDDAFDMASLGEIAAMQAAWGSKRGIERADVIAAWRAADPARRAATLETLHLVWAKADGDLRAGKGQVPPDDAYAAAATRLHDTCGELLALRVRTAYADALASALVAGRAYARAYADAKRLAGAVDFDDLIAATVRLLETPGMGEWVRYKLDLATDHVLIDEAQDTNPAQWRIVSAIADEFFAGAGTRGDKRRTLFTVGDDKQAIYGFQGTDPIYFRAAQVRFDRLASAPPIEAVERRPLETVALNESFRSVATVLRFVDAALDALPDPGMGVGARLAHVSRVAGPGSVTLLPPVIAGGDEADEEGWVDDQVREVARRVARQVRDWLASGHRLASKGRALRPEDVMILVKRRGDLASLIVARLYAEGVPVAGVDRLRLNAPLAVQDLLAAIRFVLQPGDDLSLASLLVSPLIGWTQDELMTAAVGRQGGLWRHLRATQPAERLFPLSQMLARADFASPYRFLEEILSGALDGRRRLIERLGEEARDPIEELLSAAIGFERTATPSLQRFLDWFDRGDVEIVRDSSRPQAAVRVMTAHGAKGLQAPLVILADATADPAPTRRDLIDWQPDPAHPPLPVFRPRAAERGGPLDELIADSDRREMEEHWRLFYVAATRAEEQLVIAGSLPDRAKGEAPAQSWYRAAAAAFDALGVPPGEVRVLSDPGGPPPAAPELAATPVAALPLPDWARRAAPQEARPPRPLAPSSLGDDAVADPPPGPAMRDAAERGRLLHGLFERLPALPPEHRRAAGQAWLAGDPMGTGLGSGLVDRALAIIDDPALAELFGPDALAEAPIAAVVEGQVVAGTVDRLLVTADRVRVVDFKTGRRVPGTLGDVPTYHLRQMAAYAAALSVIFPDRLVEAALLYTAGPHLIALPAEALAATKPGFAPREQSLSPRA